MYSQQHVSSNTGRNVNSVEIMNFDQKTDGYSIHAKQSVSQIAPIEVFGPFRLDRFNAILTRDHEPLTMTPKAFSLLCYFVDSEGQLLTKNAIFEQIWPKVVVSDSALSVCISEIRKVLSDSSKTPRYIETVHKRGFRFIGRTSKPSNKVNNNLETLTRQKPRPNIVGRDEPLEIMHQCMEASLAGVRQLAFVTGEPGIGKTTVVEEFLNQNLQRTTTLIAKGQCIEHYGTGEAYLPLLDVLCKLARKEGHEFVEILAQYAPTWLNHLPSLKDKNVESYSYEKSVNVCPDRMLRELTEALEVIAEKRLLILILEDLHWSDQATIDLLSFLAQRDNPIHLLIVGTYRPADAAIQSHSVKKLKQNLQLRNRCTYIPLDFLEQSHITTYLTKAFPNHDFPEQLSKIIHQQSDGNPLFMVNLLKYLQNKEFLKNVDGQWQMMESLLTKDRCIPEDLQLMIDQQVEQLDQECQTVLEAASIVSEPGGIAVQFTLTEVATVLGMDDLDVEPCLDRLARNGHFLHSLGVSEWPDGTFSSNYEFTHALYQNVLYERVSAVRKVKLHNQLGLYLEKGYGSRSVEIANKLAVHFELGRDYSRAVLYLKESAETAARRGANREAIHTLDKAQKLLARLPQTNDRDRQELSLLLLLAPAITASQGNATPEIESCYLRARELCEKLDEKSDQFRVLFGLRSFYLICGDLTKANQLAQSLLGIATELNDSNFLLEAQVGLASSEWFAGDLQASHQHALQGIALYDKNVHADHAAFYGLDPGVFCYARAGQTIWPLGYPDQALEYEKQAVVLAETLDHPYSLVFAIHNLTQVLLFRRDGEAALASAKRGKALAQQHGFSFLSAWALHLSAWALALVGDFDNARGEIERALAAKRPKAPTSDSYLAMYLAEAYRLLGDFKNGLSCLEIPCKEYSYEAERLYLEAEFLLLSNNSKTTISRVEGLYKESLEASRREILKAYELRTAMSLSRLLMAQNRIREAYECLKNITGWFQEGYDTSEFQESKQLLERLSTLLEADRQTQNVVYLGTLQAVTANV